MPHQLHCEVEIRVDSYTERTYEHRRDPPGAVAQLGEHRLCKPRVIGSNPFSSTAARRPAFVPSFAVSSSARGRDRESENSTHALKTEYGASVFLARKREIRELLEPTLVSNETKVRNVP